MLNVITEAVRRRNAVICREGHSDLGFIDMDQERGEDSTGIPDFMAYCPNCGGIFRNHGNGDIERLPATS
jgi:hypothetical protein